MFVVLVHCTYAPNFLDMVEKNGKADKSIRAPMTIIGDAIHAQTIKKELQNFRVNETYMLSPNAMKSSEC